jgi:hypothetical protein
MTVEWLLADYLLQIVLASSRACQDKAWNVAVLVVIIIIIV